MDIKFENLFKKYYLAIIVFFIAIVARFGDDLPAIFVDDSVKYYVSPYIILNKNFDMALQALNPSLLAKVINYFLEIQSKASANIIIDSQKTYALISTLMFFFIAKNLNSNKFTVAIFTLIFTLNPLMLLFEQCIMPEALFICLQLFSVFFFLKFIQSEKNSYIWSTLCGLSLGLLVITKESSALYIKLIMLALILFGSIYLIRKNFSAAKKYFLSSIIIFTSWQLIVFPINSYNLEKFDQYTISRFKPNGALLWSLTEEMVYNNPSQNNEWFTALLIAKTQKYKETYNLDPNKFDRLSFESALVEINVAGRVGRLQHPISKKILSINEYNNLCKEYWNDTIFNNPILALKNFLYNLKELLFKENYHFKPYRKSFRPGTEFETPMFTYIPFSIKNKTDPKLKGRKMIQTKYITDEKIFINEARTKELKGFVPLMVNRNTNYAFLLPTNSLRLTLVETFQYLPFTYFVLPIFIIALIIFLINPSFRQNLKIFTIGSFLSCSALYFILLPVIVHGEARYRLQFFQLMLLFIIYIANIFTDKKSKV